MKKFVSVMLSAVLAASMLAGCGNQGTNSADNGENAATGDTIKIGGIGPLTGAAASYGNSVKQGAQIAVDEINAAGGILGKQIDYMFEDDENKEQNSVNAYNTLMDNGMQVLIGSVTSNPCIAVADESVKDGILQITPSGSAKDCTKNDNAFRICFTDPQQGEKMAEYITGTAGLKKVAAIYDSSDAYSTGILNAFEEKLTSLGGELVAKEAFVSGDKDFKAQLTKIAGTDAECLFMPFYYTEVAYVAEQAKGLGISLPYFGCDGWDGVIKQLNGDTSSVEGAVFLTPFIATSSNETVQKFVKAYEEKFGATPDQFAADAYDAVYAVKAAAEKAGSFENDALIKAMAEITVEGTTGTMTFSAEGEADKTAYFAKIENGEYVAL